MAKKDIILFVNSITNVAIDTIHEYNKKKKKQYKIALIHNLKKDVDHSLDKKTLKKIDFIIPINFQKDQKIIEALDEYKDRIVAATCLGEGNMPLWKQLIPHLPYIKTPTESSVEWASNKILMRRHFKAEDPAITPRFLVLDEFSEEKIERIVTRVGLPVVVKPSGLASSLFVTVCYHEDELRKSIKKIFKKLKAEYQILRQDLKPKILVEQLMEGEMYSIDGYVNDQGDVIFCPLVHVKTGRSIGYDDFFGYMRLTPTTLPDEEVEKAEKVGYQGIHALGLRNTTFHTELIKTDEGWKIVEIGARIGGFRNTMYKLSYGFDHIMNDILNRMGKKVTVSKRRKGYTAVLQFFPKKEGILVKTQGIKKVEKLESFYHVERKGKEGEMARFARHGGRSIINVALFNKSRGRLLADVRRCEEAIKIVVE